MDFSCTACGHGFRNIPDSAAGRLGRCKKCDTQVRVPQPSAPAPVAAPPTAVQQIVVMQAQPAPRQKSRTTCIILWLLLGGMGAHAFYAGRTGEGIAHVVSLLLVMVTIGAWILVHVPLVLISGIVLMVSDWDEYKTSTV